MPRGTSNHSQDESDLHQLNRFSKAGATQTLAQDDEFEVAFLKDGNVALRHQF